MKIINKLPLLLALAAFGTTAVACEKKEKTENPDDGAAAEGDADPVAQLEQYQADIQAEMDKVMAPMTETELLITAMSEAPAKMEIDKAKMMSMFKASFENGTVEISADIEIDAEAKAELEALLNQAKELKVTFETYPETIKTSAASLVELTGKAIAQATAASASISAKLKNPMLKGEKKLELEGQLQTVTSIKTDLEGKIQEIKAMPQELPAKAAEASAKLTASFAAG